MSDNPLVSTIIPTYFRNEQLTAAIRSAEDQTYDPVEIIVVDDSGERHAELICRDLNITYLAHDENRGANPARNTGIKSANGKYIQLLDDDDELAEDKIEKQVELLQSSLDVGVVYCGLENPDGEQVYPKDNVRGNVYHDALRMDMGPCITGTMLIDSRVLERIYPLATRETSDDIGMKIRLAEITEFDYVDEILYDKGTSESHRSTKEASDREIVNIIEENMDAYRSAPDSVYRKGMTMFYRRRGLQQLRGSFWSPRAIGSFCQAIRYTDGYPPMLMAMLLTSFFGRPGYVVASAVNRKLSALRDRVQ